METQKSGRPMIYDCFTYFNELDLLEIRLEELKDVVDRFVLVEATKTFSNRPKSLCYEENKERFRKYHDRIIHVIVDDLPENPKDSWENQFYQRNAISRGLLNCAPDDIILISDVDEIPRASAVASFDGEMAFLEQNLYYYRLNCICTTEKWAIPVIMRYRNLTTPQEARMYWYDYARRQEIPTIRNAGWHFSYLGDVESIQLKLNSFSQQDFNTPEVNNKEWIEKKIDAAEDLFSRQQYQWKFVEIDESFPRIIFERKFRYAQYIKGRDLADTIFFDQYSRYKSCTDALLTVLEENDTILDVGSGADCLLGEFLPDRNITFVDPLIAKRPSRPPYMIAGDAFSRELDGKSFDYVVSIDTLEHVPPAHRAAFVERLSELAVKGLVLSFPAADAGDALATDTIINEVYRAAYGKDYLWLGEHFQNGLPAAQEVLGQLRSLKWDTTVRQNGHIPWMQELLSFTLCGLEVEDFRDRVKELNACFNHNLQLYDSAAPAYRQVLIATKEKVSTPICDNEAMTTTGEAATTWQSLKCKLLGSPFRKLKETTELIREKEGVVAETLNTLAEKERLLAEARDKVAQLTAILSERDRSLAEQNFHLARLNSIVAEVNKRTAAQDASIADLHAELVKRDATIAERDSAIANQNAVIAERDNRVAVRDAALAEQLTLQAELRTRILEQDAQISVRDADITHLNASLTEHQAELTRRAAQLTERDILIQALTQGVDDLHNSLSWRVTKPARAVVDLITGIIK